MAKAAKPDITKAGTSAAAPARARAGSAAGKASPGKAAAKKPARAATASAAGSAAPAALKAGPAKTEAAKPAVKKTVAKAAKPDITKAGTSAVAPARAKAGSAAGKASSGKAAAKKPARDVTAPAAGSAAPKAGLAKAGGKPAMPWLASYPANMPAEIGPLTVPSIGALLVDSCKRYSENPAFASMGRTISFAELERLSASFGAYFQSVGLAKGARVALMMPNVLQYPVAMMAVLRAGYVVVNVNPLYTARELEHQLQDSGAEAIVILENFASTLQAVIGKTQVRHVVVAAMGDLLGLKGALVNLVVRRVRKLVPAWSLPGHIRFNAAVRIGAARGFQPVEVGPDDIAFLQYTGGTTGVSKGATLLHRNVLSNVQQLSLWVEDAYTVKPKPARQVYVCALPLYHIFALTVNGLMGMQQGALNVLIPNPRDIPAFVKELRHHSFNIFPGLNTLFNALLNNDEFRKLDFSSLVLSLGGGMAVQQGVADRWKALTGNHITEGYGLSETSPVATANKCSSPDFTGTIGLPIPSTELSIRDDDGKELPPGEVGEICIRGPQVMAGYWNRPEETEKVMTPDGFFKTGDMGFTNAEGFTRIVDRKKDMILVSGFNVYPNELEEVVASHPGVLEVAAVGVPDERSGEAPKLFVVRRDPDLTSEALVAYCRENLTGYKRPKYIEFRDELPKTPVGKILRRKLRDS
ncbi:long-chain-fatty-acid--CoA ligase [Aquamicrobium ahrensii]|uniref:long-chain-fatty-acid--CoA ligase n=1 Tax=Aquamicrobium ahrensii TaxID=469551 RepID=UPI00361499B7